MINIKLPNGAVKSYENNEIDGFEIAKSISTSLGKSAVAMKLNGKMADLSHKITSDSEVSIITIDSDEGLEIIRHDAAHVLAQAVKQFDPKVQITIGPTIQDGFYYDIARDEPFSLDDLKSIEKIMQKIIDSAIPIEREVWNRNDAIKFFESIGEKYKAEIISDLPESEEISLYRQGDFIDLCRGPHSPNTSKVKAFKLMKLAGAYWRGDSKNQMLQRIYGTAWTKKEDLDNYLRMIEEAEKRDHRKLGKELDLFHIEEESPGMIFWHEKGWTLYRIIENYVSEKIRQDGYVEVKTPVLVDKSLWEKSGHWEKFRENMFISECDENQIMAIKPMNCPCHIQIFKQGLKSYRDLPIRMAEFGNCHRNESSGSLHGIMRVRGFVQDDAHIFCTEDQIEEETVKFCKLLKDIYKDFGFTDIEVKFSDRPEIKAGADETWDKSEEMLKRAITAAGLEYKMNPGEGAFYGPKIEFQLKDALGRRWQCGTLQLDFILPERLDASYIGSDGQKYRPVMLHRAVLGALERFIGILIENYAGKFPLWLAPVQVMVMSITNDVDDYAIEVDNMLKQSGYRSRLDTDNEKINYKIRKYSLEKIPVMVIVGKKEKDNKEVSIRYNNQEKNINYDEVLAFLSSYDMVV